MNKTGGLYLEEWKSFFDLVCAFEGVHLTPEEYLTKQYQGKPNKYVEEKCTRLDQALASGVYVESEILLASYDSDSWEGSAFVLFLRDGKLYEVNSSHCSCNDLSGQWEPELTTAQDLRFRLTEGKLGVGYNNRNIFAVELTAILNALEAEIISLP